MAVWRAIALRIYHRGFKILTLPLLRRVLIALSSGIRRRRLLDMSYTALFLPCVGLRWVSIDSGYNWGRKGASTPIIWLRRFCRLDLMARAIIVTDICVALENFLGSDVAGTVKENLVA